MTDSQTSARESRDTGRRGERAQGGEERDLIGIGELARAFDVSLRTLRFYEDRGLLIPARRGRTRLYGASDRVRLESILRWKRLGFSLGEIRGMIGGLGRQSDAGRLVPGRDQIQAQIATLEQQRRSIEHALAALRREAGATEA